MRFLFGLGAAIIFFALPVMADRALIVTGKSGGESAMRENARLAEFFATQFRTLGFTSVRILAETENFGKNKLFRELEDAQQERGRFWLVLLGNARQLRSDVVLRLPEGVFRAGELKTALDRIPARQVVFALTAAGFELQEALRAPGRMTVSGYDAPGGEEQPQWAEELARALTAPGDDWIAPLRESALAHQKKCAARNVLNRENPRITCGDEAAAMPFTAFPDTPLPPRRAGTMPIPADATAAPLSETEHPAPILLRKLEAVGSADGSLVIRETVRRVRSEACETVKLKRHPDYDSRLESARVVRADGTTLEAQIINDLTARFPDPAPGDLLEHTVRHHIPAFRRNAADLTFPLLLPVPQARFELEVSLPRGTSLALKGYGATLEVERQNGVYNDSIRAIGRDLPAAPETPDRPPVVHISSWRSFAELAAWYRSVAGDPPAPSPTVKSKVRELTRNAETESEKLKAVYDYLNALRYDTTPIGIRALRPRSPEEVIASGFGDCKDKANALVVFAAACGIRGELCLVNRNGFTDTEFPAWQFNHALCYFPEIGGGLWLDPTDAGTPFGTLPKGDAGRPALRLTDGTFLPINEGI